MADRIYYVRSQDGCLFESMTKEQILTAIEQAVDSGTITDIDTGFVTKIKEQNLGTGLKFWVGTQAQYNAIETPENDVFYIISDDSEYENIMESIEALSDSITNLQNDVNPMLVKMTPDYVRCGLDELISGYLKISTASPVASNIALNYSNDDTVLCVLKVRKSGIYRIQIRLSDPSGSFGFVPETNGWDTFTVGDTDYTVKGSTSSLSTSGNIIGKRFLVDIFAFIKQEEDTIVKYKFQSSTTTRNGLTADSSFMVNLVVPYPDFS